MGATVPSFVDLMTLGFGGAVCLVLAGAIGYGIDSVAHTSPVFTFIGLAFGLLTAVLYTVSKVRRNL